MKPRPTTILPGATHWNPNAGPDWFLQATGASWRFFDPSRGKGEWRISGRLLFDDLIPAEHLMAQQVVTIAEQASPTYEAALSEGRKAAGLNAGAAKVPEWNGEGLPPVGVVCNWNDYQVTVIGFHDDFVVCRFPDDVKPLYDGVFAAALRPINSERERAIVAMVAVWKPTMGRFAEEKRGLAEMLYDAGYRKVEK